MLWGRRIMRVDDGVGKEKVETEKVWQMARGRVVLLEATRAQAQRCVFRKGQGTELLPSEQVILTQELMGTFHFMASAMFLQPTMPAVARPGKALLSTSVKSPHQPPRDLGTNHHTLPPITTLIPTSPAPPGMFLICHLFSSSPSSGWDSWTTTASKGSSGPVSSAARLSAQHAAESVLPASHSQSPPLLAFPLHKMLLSTTEAVEAVQVIPSACRVPPGHTPPSCPLWIFLVLTRGESPLLRALSVIQSVL